MVHSFNHSDSQSSQPVNAEQVRLKAAAPRLAMRCVAALALVAGLVVCPMPAAAQHGGGGGGHAGGGGHIGGGGSHSAGSAHGGSTGAVRGPSAGMGGFSRGGVVAAHGGPSSIVSTSWQNPATHEITRFGMPRTSDSPLMGPATGMHSALRARIGPAFGMRPEIPRVFVPFGFNRFGDRFFFGGGCFGGFFPAFCGGFGPGFFGAGFGWGSPWLWGWDDDGFGEFQNYGYPYYPSMDAEIQGNVDNQPQYYESAPYSYGMEYPPPEQPNQTAGDAKIMLLYLTDGTVYALTNYWVADGKLHYVTQYGGENAIDMSQVDIQKTVDVNAKRGVSVTLRPGPQAAPPQAAPPSQGTPPPGEATPNRPPEAL
jgi:hypothetical protein